jgi:hypothetical protein
MAKKNKGGAPRGSRNGNANKRITPAIRLKIQTDPEFSARKWARKLDVYESTAYRIRSAK